MTEDSNWNQDTLLVSLWEWFCKLGSEERMQALAIDDPLWIRLYLKLFKHELKSRNKKLVGAGQHQASASPSSPPAAPLPSSPLSSPQKLPHRQPLCYSVRREKVNYMYSRLLKQQLQHQQHVWAGCLPSSSSKCHSNINTTTTNSSSGIGSRGDTPVGVSSDPDDLEEAKSVEEEEEELEVALAAEEEEHTLTEGYRIALGQQKQETWKDREDMEHGELAGGIDNETTAQLAGYLLQRSLRICSLGATPLDTLTLGASAVEDAEALYQLLRAVTKGAFLSKPLTAATVKQLSLKASAAAAAGGGGGGSSSAAMAGGSGSGSGIGTSGVASNAVGTSAAGFSVVLPEAPWLQERTEAQKETVPLRDLLVSRLELSLWVAFWRRVHRCPAPAPRVSAGLKAVAVQTKHLQAFAAKLQPAEQAALFEGLRPAQQLLLQQLQLQLPGEEEERVIRPCRKDEKHQQEGLERARESRAQVMMERLLLMPVHWVYQDEGKAVRRALERVQAACADSVARELLNDDDWGSIGSSYTSASAACTAGKKKKKQQQRLKELQRLGKQLRAEAEASMLMAARQMNNIGLHEGGRKVEDEEDLAVQSSSVSSAVRVPFAAKSGQRAAGLVTAMVMEEGKDDDGSWAEVGPRGVVVKKPSLASTLVPPAFEAFPPLRLPTTFLSSKATAGEKILKKGRGQEASSVPLSPVAPPPPPALMGSQSTPMAVAKTEKEAVRSDGEDEKTVELAAVQSNGADDETVGIEAAKKKMKQKKKKKKAAAVEGVESTKQEEVDMSTTPVMGRERSMVVVKEPAAGGVAAAGAGAASALFSTSPLPLPPPLTSSVLIPVAPFLPPASDPPKIFPITTLSSSSLTDSVPALVPTISAPTVVSISSSTALAAGLAEPGLPPSAPLCSIGGGGKKNTEWEGRIKDRQHHQGAEGGRGVIKAEAAVAPSGRTRGIGGEVEVGRGGLVALKPPEVPEIVVGEIRRRPKSKIRSQYKNRRKMREVIAAIMAGVLDRVDLVVSGAQPLPTEVEGPPGTKTTTTMAREEMVEEKVKQGPSELPLSKEQPQSVNVKTKTEERPHQAPLQPESVYKKETEQRPTRAQQQQQNHQLKLQGEMQVEQQQKQQQPQPQPQPQPQLQQIAAQQEGDVQEISKVTNVNANPKPSKQQQQQQQQQRESPSARLVSLSYQKQNPSLTSPPSSFSFPSSSSYGNGTKVQAAPQKQVQQLTTKKQRQQEQQQHKRKQQLQEHQQPQQQQQQQKQQQEKVKFLSAYAQPQLAAKQKYNSKDTGGRTTTTTATTTRSVTSGSVAINDGRPPLQLGPQYVQPIYQTGGVGCPARKGRKGGGESSGGGDGGRASGGGHIFQSTRQPLYSRLHQQHHTPQYYQEYPSAHGGGAELGGSMVGGGGGGRRGTIQRLDGRKEWGENCGHHMPHRYSAAVIPQVSLYDCLNRHQRHHHDNPQLQHQQRAPHRHVGGDGGRSGSSTMDGGVYESVMPPPLVMQQAHEVYALDLEAEKAHHAYCQGIDAMRALLTDNIATFMAKREADMKTHRAAREMVLGELRTIIQGLWSGARVELYGSCFTGLDLVSSDVDIVVCGLSLTGSTANTTPQMTRHLEQRHNESTASSSPDGGYSVATTISSGSGSSSSRASTTVATGPSSAASSVVDEEEEETDIHSHSQLSDTSSSSVATRSTPAGSRSPALSSPASSPRLGPATSASNSSIIFMSATPPRPLPPGHGESTRLLYQLAATLECRPWVRSLKTIDTAFIPVIKILADPAVLMGVPDSLPTPATALVPVDISFEGRQHGGIASSLLIRDLVAPGRPYAHAVPLTLVLKALMTQRGLNQPWCGGVSSYALMLMVIAVLQQFETPEVAQANVLAIARSVDTIKRRAIPPVPSNSSSCNAGCRGSGGSGSSGSDVRSRSKGVTIPADRDKTSRRLHSSGNPVPDGPMDYGKALRGGNGPLEEPVTAETTLMEVKPPPPLVKGGYGSPAEISYRLWSQFAAAQMTSDGGMEDRNDGGGKGVESADGNSEKKGMTSGFLLTYFLEYFGRIFNPQVEGIAVDQGYGLTFPLADFFLTHGLPVVADPLTILDPLDRAVNVSRCAFRIGEIQVLFQQCLASLEAHGIEMGRRILQAPAAEDGWSHVGGAGSGGKKKKTKGGASGGGQWQGQAPMNPVPLPPTADVLSLMLSY